MPHPISRDEALRRIREESGGVACVPCALRSGQLPRRMLAETAHSTVVLSAYPRRWGHVLVVLAEHVTTFAALSAAAWADAAAHARVAARVVERVLAPERCYVASLGTAIDGLELTFPHIHLHVIPVYDPDDRPSTVLSTADGMLAADEDEWEALHAQLRAAWP